MLFVFNVGALNIAVLLIRRGLCIPIGTAGFKLLFLSGISGELAHTVLSPNSSDFVYFYCLFCFHNFLSQHKKSIRTDIFFPQCATFFAFLWNTIGQMNVEKLPEEMLWRCSWHLGELPEALGKDSATQQCLSESVQGSAPQVQTQGFTFP